MKVKFLTLLLTECFEHCTKIVTFRRPNESKSITPAWTSRTFCFCKSSGLVFHRCLASFRPSRRPNLTRGLVVEILAFLMFRSEIFFQCQLTPKNVITSCSWYPDRN